MSVPNLPVKKLSATVTIKLPLVEADPQNHGGYYDPQMQADFLKSELLGDNLLDILEPYFTEDTLVIEAEVEVNDGTEPQETND